MDVAAELTVEDLLGDPHPWWHRLRGEAPVAWVPALGGWVITSYAAAARVLRDAATFTVDDPRFSTAQLFGPSMLSTDGAEHDRFRGAFAAAFRRADVEAGFAGFVQEQIDALLAAGAAAGELEVRSQLAGPLAVAVMAQALGLADVGAATLLDWYSAIVDGVNRISTGQPAGVDAVRAHGALQARLASAVRSERCPISGRGLSVDEAAANAGILLFGGIETTEGMIALALGQLLERPEQWQAVLADRTLLPNAVEESLRYEPAAARVDRYATADVVLDGASVAAGDLVIVSLTAANRDPAVFAEPDSFDVRRVNAARNLALALGPHYCLGAHLARLETQLVVASIMDRWPNARLVTSTAPRGLVFRKPAEVRLRW